MVALAGDRVRVSLIPHTAAVTTLGRLKPGSRVNLEADLIAKYVYAFVAGRKPDGGLTWEKLAGSGVLMTVDHYDATADAVRDEEPHEPFATIDAALEDLREGRMVIVCDDEDRENEGDLTMAAQFATAEKINFMAKEGRGLVCLTLTPQRCASSTCRR